MLKPIKIRGAPYGQVSQAITTTCRQHLPDRWRPGNNADFPRGLDLPDFASFTLLQDEAGRAALQHYFQPYLALARKYDVGFILDSATWRANADWGTRLGYSAEKLAEVNRKAIAFLGDIRSGYETGHSPMVINGVIGPRGDGYVPSAIMSAAEAQHYHAAQIDTFRQTDADMVTALTMNYVDEPIGIVRAAKAVGMPIVIGFTVETDGTLPTGPHPKDAIECVDAATQNAPMYYMINCAHPTHFDDVLVGGEAWTERIRGIRANASRMSHAELNESADLDEGAPVEFGRQYRALVGRLKKLNVLGGCCGTDHRHVEEICKACIPQV